MKRGTKILLLLLALAVLGGAYALLTANGSQEEEETPAVTLFYADPDTVTHLSWVYAGNTYGLTRTDDVWSCDNDAALPLDSSTVETMLGVISSVTAKSTLDSPEDLSQYELGDDQGILLTVTTADGDKTLHLGCYNSYADGCYATADGASVSLVDDTLRSDFSCTLLDLVQKETLPDLTNLSYFNISQADSELVLRYAGEDDDLYTESGSHWNLMQTDGYTALDDDTVDTLVQQVTGLSWQTVLAYNVTDFSDYGGDDCLLVHIVYTDADEAEQSMTLCVGGDTEDGAYAWLDGSSIVYEISASVAESLRSATANSLLGTS